MTAAPLPSRASQQRGNLLDSEICPKGDIDNRIGDETITAHENISLIEETKGRGVRLHYDFKSARQTLLGQERFSMPFRASRSVDSQTRFAAIANHYGRHYHHVIVAMNGDTSCLARIDKDVPHTVLAVSAPQKKNFQKF